MADDDDYENVANVLDKPIRPPKQAELDETLPRYDNIKEPTRDIRTNTYIEPDLPQSSKKDNSSKYWIAKIIFVILAVVILIIAFVLSIYAVVLNKNQNDEKSSQGLQSKENCDTGPCKNQGKCVNIIQGGYYCICDSQKYFGRHCEGELHSERPKLYPTSCQNIKQNDNSSKSGIYMIQITGEMGTFPVYCDQDTAGGGWTLVWSYGFTNYENFADKSNAVTPIPLWSSTFITNVEPSTTTPLGEDDLGAMNFKLWKNFGSEFLVKSNINNWISCTPNGGSLTELRYGRIQCTLERIVIDCTASHGNTAPVMLDTQSTQAGPILKGTTGTSSSTRYRHNMYDFNGNTASGSPVHDPCQRSGQSHKKNVQNSYGAVYVRS